MSAIFIFIMETIYYAAIFVGIVLLVACIFLVIEHFINK